MRLARILLGLLVFAVVVYGARTARALSCDQARPFLSPADGESVPPNPVLYLFDPLGQPRPQVRVGGRPGRPKLKPVGENGRFRVYALEITAPAGAETLEVVLAPGQRYHYRIDPDWRRPQVEEPLWAKVTDRAWQNWVAEGSTHLAIQAPVAAAAYKVEVAPARGEAGKQVVVPGLGDGGRWVYADHPGVCDGVFASAERGAWMSVGALFVDGGESEMTEPVLLESTGWGDRSRAFMLLGAAALLVAGFFFSTSTRPH